MATSLLMEISQDEKERARYRSRRMAETDYDSNMLASERIGVMKTIRLIEMGHTLDEIRKMATAGQLSWK